LRREPAVGTVCGMPEKVAKPVYFATPADFRAWLEKHHATAKELLVGFHKVGSGTPSMTWPESVEEALCFGWIDGVRKRVDNTRYTIRFSPRKSTSVWSAVNIAKMEELIREGRVRPAGLEAFEKRDEEKSRRYSYEQRSTAQLEPAAEKRFRSNKTAWQFFQSRPPWYRRTATWFVASARKPETREKRLTILIDCCARSELLPGIPQRGK
jgi:uncharacterized protein YdeI (YjbR/CyaY-like superfamily)